MNKIKCLVLVLSCFIWPVKALATNGMLMEGYGPISQAMGGASMAFDNGAAAMANNPATLSLMPANSSRLDLALGVMKPSVRYTVGGASFKSSSDIFFMPAVGFVTKKGRLAYGLGVYAQGGMGTDYLGSMPMYSQVMFGKLILPASVNVTDRLAIGGTLEYLHTGMDLVMWPFNFKNGSDFSGTATGGAVTGKLGLIYQASDSLTLGAAYQHKGGLDRLEGGGATVKGLDLPAFFGAGLSYKVTDKLLLALDYKRILWSNSMKTIEVTQSGVIMPIVQNWRDQNVVALGLAYDLNEALTLRAGVNLANNPVNQNATPLFPAIIQNHYTAGFGYHFNDKRSLDFSLSHAPKVTVDNGLGFGGTTSHSQTNMQLMYSLHF